mmetsp:Transcript_3438/g.8473  ORF Transcript_3438/g.8473 Transcript_3438/m.8473 type:complete len:342 (-) Transcript_3438:88-1113(-)
MLRCDAGMSAFAHGAVHLVARPDPVCSWKCKKPQHCPKPECKMFCEKPPDCDSKPTIRPAHSGEVVVGTGHAQQGVADWSSDSWGRCSESCGHGTMTRQVRCSSGYEADCPVGRKPSSSKECKDMTGCQFVAGAWSQCSARCGEGEQVRDVTCAGEECPGSPPPTSRSCRDDSSSCTDCQVTLFGGPKFDGWSIVLDPGSYGSADLEVLGAKCDDVSSLTVQGVFCEAETFQYGDFNKGHKGWVAKFGSGSYDVKGLVDRGARDNDISSLKVRWAGGAGASRHQDESQLPGTNPWNAVPDATPTRTPFPGERGSRMSPFRSCTFVLRTSMLVGLVLSSAVF